MKIQTRNKINPTFNMSSLTDIIFLLLIFFLLTSSLVSFNALEIVLPSANSATTVKPKAAISITGDKQYYYDADPIEFNQLAGLLEQHKTAMLEEAEGKEEVVPTIVLNAEKTVPIEEVVKVFELAKEMELQVILATKPK